MTPPVTVATVIDSHTSAKLRERIHGPARQPPSTSSSCSGSGGSTPDASSEDESSSATSLDSSSDEDSDSEAEGEYLRQRIQHHKEAGPTKSKRKDPNGLIPREFEHFKAFCAKLKIVPRPNPEQILRECKPEMMKAYVEWRRKNFRIKEESSLCSYWRRIGCSYKDLVGRRMDNGTDIEIYNFIPTLGLKKTKKEKPGMYVQDFHIIHSAHWKNDDKALHGYIRVAEDLVMLLSVATATRPGALIEGGAAKGSNKALCWEHVLLMKVPLTADPGRSTIVALVDLVHVKNAEGSGRKKKFIFRLEPMLGFCIVSRFLALAFANNAFRRNFASVEEIFNLEIPPQRETLRLRFKKEKLAQPVFRDVDRKSDDLCVPGISNTKALAYQKFRAQFVWLGDLVGMELRLEPYHMRRGSGRNINKALTTAERNQTLGQQGQVYEQFYIPELIEADYQSIYFGTPSEDELIRAAARMGLSHDSRAPLGLTDAQKEEIRNDPEIMRLRDKRGRYTEKLVRQGYRPIETGKGTSLYARYEKIDRRIKSMTTQLKRARESQAKKDFHDTIDDLEINKQLDGAELPEMPTRARAMQFEFPERARIVRLMSLNLTELEEGEALAARMKFIRTLARYCHKQESRKFRGSTDVVKLDKYDSIKRKRYPAEGPASGSMTRQKPAVEGATSLPKVGVDERGSLKRRRSTSEDGGGGAVAKRPKLNTGETAPAVKTEDHDIDDDVVEVRLPMTFDDFVCIRCLRHLKKGASREALTKPLKRKFTLQRHLQDIHINNGEFDEPFECDHPDCAEIIDGVMHYKAHCFRVHRVEH